MVLATKIKQPMSRQRGTFAIYLLLLHKQLPTLYILKMVLIAPFRIHNTKYYRTD